jgi:phosphoserine phosphatase
MTFALTFVSHDTDALGVAAVRLGSAVAALGASVKTQGALGPHARDWAIEGGSLLTARQAASDALADLPVDVCVQAAAGRRKRLLLADMDSTIIDCECLDELADYAGVKAAVSAITERAMRGELDFAAALKERVAMLKGLPGEVIAQCYAERVRLNSGARTLVSTMAANGARCVLVSGGFTSFTRRVAKTAGFHADFANTLGENGGVLTGVVAEPILGREAKLAALEREAAALSLDLGEALSVGDGANDLDMIRAAGLGVAYRAKPVVAAQADARVDYFDLTALLYFQGYATSDFVRDAAASEA